MKNTFQHKDRKAFTIVELVIVIAVIAILAAVLIPTFSNIIKRSQISADVQLCRNLNTVLANADALGRHPGSMYDVLYLENEAGYIIDNLNPTAEGYYYAWDQKNNKIVYLLDDLKTVYFPEDYTVNPGDCWITASTPEEMQHLADFGYNICLENDITEPIELHNVVSINTLGFSVGNITMNSGSIVPDTVNLIGAFGSTSINAGATNVKTSGSMTGLSVQGSGQVTLGGYVNSYSAAGGVSSVVSSTGMINTVAAGNSSNITNNGVVLQSTNAGQVSGNAVGTKTATVTLDSKEGIESIRTQLATTSRDFAGETVKLTADINMAGIAFVPVANTSREGINANSTNVFKGTWDGDGHAIQNFATSGFSLTGLNAGTNSSTPYFGSSKVRYSEAVYGLVGVSYNAEFKNLTVTCDINMVLDNSQMFVGDSVGAIVGCAFGTVKFENCTVSGSITAYDGVGGFLGRLKGTKAEFINCVNNATVTGVRKTGGFIGSSYDGNYEVIYTNCVNNGNVTCLGVEKDMELGCWDGVSVENGVVEKEGVYMASKPEVYTAAAKNGTGYYTASASNGEFLSASTPGTQKSNKVTVNGENGFVNNGIIKVGDVNVGNGTYKTYESGKWVDHKTGN